MHLKYIGVLVILICLICGCSKQAEDNIGSEILSNLDYIELADAKFVILAFGEIYKFTADNELKPFTYHYVNDEGGYETNKLHARIKTMFKLNEKYIWFEYEIGDHFLIDIETGKCHLLDFSKQMYALESNPFGKDMLFDPLVISNKIFYRDHLNGKVFAVDLNANLDYYCIFTDTLEDKKAVNLVPDKNDQVLYLRDLSNIDYSVFASFSCETSVLIRSFWFGQESYWSGFDNNLYGVYNSAGFKPEISKLSIQGENLLESYVGAFNGNFFHPSYFKVNLSDRTLLISPNGQNIIEISNQGVNKEYVDNLDVLLKGNASMISYELSGDYIYFLNHINLNKYQIVGLDVNTYQVSEITDYNNLINAAHNQNDERLVMFRDTDGLIKLGLELNENKTVIENLPFKNESSLINSDWYIPAVYMLGL